MTTKSHLRIAHDIGEQLMVTTFDARQRRVIDLILRLSWGCGKEIATIPKQKDFEAIGVGEGHIKEILELLIRDNIIIRNENNYSINRNYDIWRVTRARHYLPEKLTELVRINLNHKPSKTYRIGKKSIQNNLPNMEERTYRKGKKQLTEKVSPPDTKLASPIESIIETTISKKESIKKESITTLLKNYSPEFQTVFLHFIEMRKLVKKPMTAYAVELALKKLDKLSPTEKDKIAIINRSIEGGWQGLYSLKTEGGGFNKQDNKQGDEFSGWGYLRDSYSKEELKAMEKHKP